MNYLSLLSPAHSYFISSSQTNKAEQKHRPFFTIHLSPDLLPLTGET